MRKIFMMMGLLLTIQLSFSQDVGDQVRSVKLGNDIELFSYQLTVNDNGFIEKANYVELFENGYYNTHNGVQFVKFKFRDIDDQVVYVEKALNPGKHLRLIVTSKSLKKVQAVYTAPYGLLRGDGNVLTVESTSGVCPEYIYFCI